MGEQRRRRHDPPSALARSAPRGPRVIAQRMPERVVPWHPAGVRQLHQQVHGRASLILQGDLTPLPDVDLGDPIEFPDGDVGRTLGIRLAPDRSADGDPAEGEELHRPLVRVGRVVQSGLVRRHLRAPPTGCPSRAASTESSRPLTTTPAEPLTPSTVPLTLAPPLARRPAAWRPRPSRMGHRPPMHSCP